MQKKSISRISTIATPMMIVCVLLVSGTSVRAQSEGDGPCSNRTLLGDYGFAVEGLILPAPYSIRRVVPARLQGQAAGPAVPGAHIVTGASRRGGDEGRIQGETVAGEHFRRLRSRSEQSHQRTAGSSKGPRQEAALHRDPPAAGISLYCAS
jgi:hypothetical protein